MNSPGCPAGAVGRTGKARGGSAARGSTDEQRCQRFQRIPPARAALRPESQSARSEIPFPGGSLADYALAGSPGIVVAADGSMVFEYTLRGGADEVEGTPEWSADLLSWEADRFGAVEQSTDAAGNRLLRLNLPADPRGFARLRLTLIP